MFHQIAITFENMMQKLFHVTLYLNYALWGYIIILYFLRLTATALDFNLLHQFVDFLQSPCRLYYNFFY